jgi:hypothetical protein
LVQLTLLNSQLPSLVRRYKYQIPNAYSVVQVKRVFAMGKVLSDTFLASLANERREIFARRLQAVARAVNAAKEAQRLKVSSLSLCKSPRAQLKLSVQ